MKSSFKESIKSSMSCKWGFSTAIKERKNARQMVRGNETHVLYTLFIPLPGVSGLLSPASKGRDLDTFLKGHY